MKAIRVPLNRKLSPNRSCNTDVSGAKTVYSKMALVVLATWVIGFVLQVVWAYLTRSLKNSPFEDMNKWITVAFPLYLVAFPMGLHIVKDIPDKKPAKAAFPKMHAFAIFCICIVLIYAGSFLGEGLASVLTGGRAQNIISNEALSTKAPYAKFVTIVLIGPFMEELLFRKVLIDKTMRFGEKKAIVFSAVVFGLFHMNLFQFFYTAMVGTVLAYLYVKTGRVCIPFIYHAVINFLGGFLPAYIRDSVDFESLSEMGADAIAMEIAGNGTLKMQLVLSVAYYGIMTGALLLGVFFILKTMRNVNLRKYVSVARNSVFFKSAVLNIGFIALFMLFCLVSSLTLAA